MLYVKPCPMDMFTPIWLRQSLWHTYDTSTHHLTTCMLLALIISTSLTVSFRYCSHLTDFFQASLSGYSTLVVKKAIVVSMSPLALLLTKRFLAVKVWNNRTCFSSSLAQSTFTFSKCSPAGVFTDFSSGSGHILTVSLLYYDMSIMSWTFTLQFMSVHKFMRFFPLRTVISLP